MLVPPFVVVAKSLDTAAEIIDDPGANMLTQLPQLEKDDLVSEGVEDPTVMARWALAGLKLQASSLPFPAATTVVTPDCTSEFTALTVSMLVPPPRLTLVTAGFFLF